MVLPIHDGDGEGVCSRRTSTIGGMQQQVSNVDDSPHACMSPRFRNICLKLGMSEGALYAWEKLFVQSEAAIVCFFGVEVLALWLWAYLLHGAVRTGHYVYVFRVPIVVLFLTTVIFNCLLWRRGQPATDTALYKVSFLAYAPSGICILMAGYTCPVDSIPFRSPLQFTAVVSVLVFTINVFSITIPVQLPSQPNKSLLATVAIPSSLGTLRTMDSLTDLSFLQILGTMRAEGCWWFGHPGSCGTYTALQATIWFLAILDLFGGILLNTVTAMVPSTKRSNKILVLHGVNALCELGIIAVTILKLISDRRDPNNHSTKNQEQLILMMLSIAMTLMTFSLTVVGAGSAFAGAKVVALRVTEVGAHGYRRSVGGLKSVPAIILEEASLDEEIVNNKWPKKCESEQSSD